MVDTGILIGILFVLIILQEIQIISLKLKSACIEIWQQMLDAGGTDELMKLLKQADRERKKGNKQ